MSKLMDLLEKEAGIVDTGKAIVKNVLEHPNGAVEGVKGFAKANAGALGGAAAGIGAVAGAGLLAKAVKPTGAGKLLSLAMNHPNAASTIARNPKATAAALALGVGGAGFALGKAASVEKTAAEVAYDQMEMAKQAAEELAEESMAKLAFAEQLFLEASYVTDSLTKEASEIDALESDGSALEAFLEELDAEVGE
jgi:hypothetical protein